MGWLSFLRLLLATASAVATIVKARQLLAAGEKAGEGRAIARSIAEISDRLQISRELVSEIERLTDDEIDKALRGDG